MQDVQRSLKRREIITETDSQKASSQTNIEFKLLYHEFMTLDQGGLAVIASYLRTVPLKDK